MREPESVRYRGNHGWIIYGPGNFAGDSDCVGQIQDQAYYTVWPFDAARRDVVWPFPAWKDRK